MTPDCYVVVLSVRLFLYLTISQYVLSNKRNKKPREKLAKTDPVSRSPLVAKVRANSLIESFIYTNLTFLSLASFSKVTH